MYLCYLGNEVQRMRKITFRTQLYIGILFVMSGFLLSTIFQNGIFSNLAHIFYGLLFVVHPAVPEHFTGNKYAIACSRATGIVIIVLGLVTRYGV